MEDRWEWEDYSPDGKRWAASPRGWLWGPIPRSDIGQRSAGYYLDYGPDHYRSPHARLMPNRTDICCSSRWPCRGCEPGDVFAVVVDGPHHYFPTVEQARAWIESQVGAA